MEPESEDRCERRRLPAFLAAAAFALLVWLRIEDMRPVTLLTTLTWFRFV